MALEDLATFNGTQKDCGKVIDFTPPVTFNFAPDPTKSARIKSKTNQITEAFIDMTAQFKNTFFRTR